MSLLLELFKFLVNLSNGSANVISNFWVKIGTKVSNGTKTLSIIEVLRIRAEGQVAAKNREMDLREREIELAER